MMQTIEAIFDGTSLQPAVPLNLETGERVRITVERVGVESQKSPQTFLQTALSLNLEGEPDWSERS